MIIIGLVILIAAIVTGIVGVLGNSGGTHALTHGFSVFGYHVTGSTGALFLTGMVVGAVALFGLSLLLAGARRTSRRGRTARRDLTQSRRETAAASQDREALIDQRDTARADAASTPGNGSPDTEQPVSDNGQHSRSRLFGRRPAGAAPTNSER
jgi:uncharacterized protein (DUF3084 family)